jgi:simple sugar transport system ATP-binding protein
MRSLTKQGKSIIFITHKLREVLDISDRIMVIRRGAVVGEADPKKADKNKLAEMMVGREVNLVVEKESKKPGANVLEVKDLVVTDVFHQVVVDHVSLDVHAGQVLGIAGVQGNGQTELVEVLTGLKKSIAGTVKFEGREITNASPRAITEIGSAHVPEDRQADGLVLPSPVSENLVLCTYYKEPFSHGIVMHQEEILKNSVQLIKDFDIRTPGPLTSVGSLSGGNQQKVIIARELSRPIKLLIASQPTRGLDVGSIEYIHKRIVQKRDEGCAVLLVSPELDEIIELSDRIAVMFRGKIIATVNADDISKETLGLLMAGIVPDKIEKKSSKVVETTF